MNRKRGLPFIFKRYKKRKVFLGALLFIAGIILISSQFVWNIEVVGNKQLSADDIIAELNDTGLCIGKWKKDINLADVINEMRMKNEKISWIGIELEGTNAIVEIAEALEKPKLIDYNKICDIVANKPGIIQKISVQNGMAKVQVGDEVSEGDILVEGKMEGKWTEARMVHSMADIEAIVPYEKSIKLYFEQENYVRTGESENKYCINFNIFQINLYKKLSKFEKCDTIYENKKVKLFSNFYLPIEIRKITNYETIKQTNIYTQKELEQQAKSKLENELKSEIENPENILEEKFFVKSVEQDFIECQLVYYVLENIGVES